jgi:CIC family chloride channel protein
LVFSLLCSVVGYVYVLTFYGLRNHFFRKLPIPNQLKPAVGGFLLGLTALWLPQLRSGGYGWIQPAIDGKMTLVLLVVLCFGKIVTTSFTISSGGSGGVFAPSLYIGAMLGGRTARFATSCSPAPLRIRKPLCWWAWEASLRAWRACR